MTPIVLFEIVLLACSNDYFPFRNFIVEDRWVECADVVLPRLGGNIVLRQWIPGASCKNAAGEWTNGVWRPSRDEGILNLVLNI